MKSAPYIIHIPTPGDHYSPSTGSAIMTITYETAREHARAGGCTRILVASGTRHDYGVGEVTEVGRTRYPWRAEKAVDIAAAWAGLPRPFVNRLYAPVVRALPPSFDGVILLHNTPGPLPALRARCPEATICLWLHNAVFRTYRPGEAERVLRAADRVLCHNEFMARYVRDTAPGAADLIRVVPNGVDTERFVPGPARPASDPPVILFVARIVPAKGADLLLAACRLLADRGVPFRARVVGSSGFKASAPLSLYERRLRRMAQPLGKAVEFQPFVDRAAIVREYQAADIFCAPSNWDEPCTLTVPEALACGLPTVAANRGGIPEIGGDAVLYFDTPDVAALADRLQLLLTDAEARAEYGRRARERALGLSWTVQYGRLVAAVGPGRRNGSHAED